MKEQDLKIDFFIFLIIGLYVKTGQCKRRYGRGERYIRSCESFTLQQSFFFLNKNRLSTNYVQNIMLGIKEK